MTLPLLRKHTAFTWSLSSCFHLTILITDTDPHYYSRSFYHIHDLKHTCGLLLFKLCLQALYFLSIHFLLYHKGFNYHPGSEIPKSTFMLPLFLKHTHIPSGFFFFLIISSLSSACPISNSPASYFIWAESSSIQAPLLGSQMYFFWARYCWLNGAVTWLLTSLLLVTHVWNFKSVVISPYHPLYLVTKS